MGKSQKAQRSEIDSNDLTENQSRTCCSIERIDEATASTKVAAAACASRCSNSAVIETFSDRRRVGVAVFYSLICSDVFRIFADPILSKLFRNGDSLPKLRVVICFAVCTVENVMGSVLHRFHCAQLVRWFVYSFGNEYLSGL